MSMILAILVGFDPQTSGFTFEGMEPTTDGLRLRVPYTGPDNPQQVLIQRPSGPQPWRFQAISFIGAGGSELVFLNAWRTVTAAGVPASLGNPDISQIEVRAFEDSQIEVFDTNLAIQVNVGIRFQVTIEMDDGTLWTSPDPQIINEKKDE